MIIRIFDVAEVRQFLLRNFRDSAANPLEDIGNTRSIQTVVLNGSYFDRHALDKLLADAAATAGSR
jgi:hypothetical protein